MSANTEAQGSGRGLEAMKWVVVVALLLVAIVGNYLYPHGLIVIFTER